MQLTLLNDSGKFDGLDDTITHVLPRRRTN